MERAPIPPFHADDRDQVIVMHGVSWKGYEAILEARGEAPRPKLAYLDGELEIMTTSFRHEVGKKLLARLVEAWAEERDVPANGAGNTTFRKKAKKAGLEPDECYWIGRIRKAPDLAIEIVHTSGGIDKLEIYRRLGVPEVWFWIRDRIWVYRLIDGEYEEATTSTALAGIDLEEIARIIVSSSDDSQTATVRAYRRSLHD